MPVVAVAAAAVLDIGVIGTAITAGIGAVTALAAITAIGATVGAVGAVTHNKTLMMIGAGIGIVGAVGSLAFGSGALGTVGDLFGPTSMSAADTATLGADAASLGSQAADTVTAALGVPAAEVGGGVINAAGAFTPSYIPGGSFEMGATASQRYASAMGTAGDTTGAAAGTLSKGVADTATAAASETPHLDAYVSGSGYMPGALPKYNIPDLSGGTASKLMSWAEDHPTLAFGAMQAGGSLLSGLTNPVSPAQIEALNAQAEVNRQQAALLKKQAENQNAAIPSVSPTVTGKIESPSGLINNAASKTALITGAPYTSAQLKTTAPGAAA